MLKKLLILILVLVPLLCQTQVNFYRIKTDFSIKEKRADGSFALQLGTAYYDLTKKRLLYEMSFPEKQTMLTTDSSVHLFKNGLLQGSKKTPGFIQMSIFHLCLTGDLKSFGLVNTPFKASKVEKSEDLVITTWELPSPPKDTLLQTKILTSTKGRQLYGVVFMDGKDQVVSKQFYLNYEYISGISVPRKIVFIMYIDGKEQKRIMEFKSVELNEKGNENLYNYPIPTK